MIIFFKFTVWHVKDCVFDTNQNQIPEIVIMHWVISDALHVIFLLVGMEPIVPVAIWVFEPDQKMPMHEINYC